MTRLDRSRNILLSVVAMSFTWSARAVVPQWRVTVDPHLSEETRDRLIRSIASFARTTSDPSPAWTRNELTIRATDVGAFRLVGIPHVRSIERLPWSDEDLRPFGEDQGGCETAL